VGAGKSKASHIFRRPAFAGCLACLQSFTVAGLSRYAALSLAYELLKHYGSAPAAGDIVIKSL
jgi:hypothetical protein